jgi:hypothetical protein
LGDGTNAESFGALPYAGANRIRFYGCFSAVLATAPRACRECNRATERSKGSLLFSGKDGGFCYRGDERIPLNDF